MITYQYPTINLEATGNNIRRLRKEKKITVKELSNYLGFNEGQAIYKWQQGQSIPSVDNLIVLSELFHVPIDQILIREDR